MCLSPLFQVGYGDIYCTTDWGKVFSVFYILFAISLFTNFVPELVQIVGRRPK